MYREKPPSDQAGERQAKSEQEDAKRALRESEAELQRRAAPERQVDTHEDEAARTAQQEAEAAERFERIADDVADDVADEA